MIDSLDPSIDKYVHMDIALSAKDISACASSREWFLDRLRATIEAEPASPQLCPGTPFVNFGSYFKRTKVRDVDEFDVLVVIDSNLGSFSYGGNLVGLGQGSAFPNNKYHSRFLKADGSGVSPAKILSWFHGVVRRTVESFGGEEPARDGPAVVARIISRDLAIDLVPAGIFDRRSDGSTFYNIAKGDAGDSWTLTAPRQDIEDLDDAATDRPNLRNVIRILKRISDTYALRLPSFAIERQVLTYARGTTWTSSIGREVRYAITSLASALQNRRVDDPFELAANLLEPSVDYTLESLTYRLIAARLDEFAARTYAYDADQAVRRLFENTENT